MKDITKIVKSLEDSGLLFKGDREGFLSMLLCALGASLLGNILAGKGKIGAIEGVVRAMEVKEVKNKNKKPRL